MNSENTVIVCVILMVGNVVVNKKKQGLEKSHNLLF